LNVYTLAFSTQNFNTKKFTYINNGINHDGLIRHSYIKKKALDFMFDAKKALKGGIDGKN
jgi:hypothetical protein